ncbi:beta-galactosidase [Herbiconiux sp. VKM Ac-1786]|uniref:beta-galactosidase n=1 Tax=Herbiconiux sp. VKM Ac-1786 TaxID=2783824 RepID=UPI00188A47A1|nr:beta-galactosidase [Herbiconiux sp. VKM Ac-1786]MBF4571811.1 beta-galactosidase [Herbiconiux sp. VKM Ac-1786]
MSTDRHLPAITGEVQFWRMEPRHWEPALRAVRELGIRSVATYLSWRRHEPVRGERDLDGRTDPSLDVRAFLRLCRENDLTVILKPGPWICAEEPNGGFPDWIVAETDLLARDHAGEVVIGYNPPFLHPMPSYASSRFRAETERWLRWVWGELAEFTGPEGPVVATQYDNEPSLGFRDTMYGFDHHPEALASWERRRPGAPAPQPRVDGPLEPTEAELDWIAWQHEYISDYLAWIAAVTADAAPGLLGTVNLNTHPVRGEPQSGPVIAAALPGAVVGEDHYFVPPLDENDLAGLALAAAQAATSDTARIWAPEMQSGIWRSPGELVEYPDPTDDELAAWWGAAIALGYQGFNLYMLVDRENWEFAPIGPDGSHRPLAEAVARLVATLESVPGLDGYRPLVDETLPWSDALRSRAYRIRGRQADPTTPWDLPEARAAYDAVEAAAFQAVLAGRQFALDPGADAPSVARTPPVASPAGVLARIHENAEGERLLHVVRWSRTASAEVALVLREHQGSLVHTLDGTVTPIDDDGRVTLSPGAGLQLYRV